MTSVTVRMTGIRMLMVILLISESLAKQTSDKASHPNSVYSQMHPKHSRKAADMKIFYQTGVSAIYYCL